MQWFLWDEFDIWLPECTISRWLKREDIRKKRIRSLATERNQFLRDDWIRRLAQWKHHQTIFVESAASERTKDRKHGGHLLVFVLPRIVLINDQRDGPFFQNILAAVDILPIR